MLGRVRKKSVNWIFLNRKSGLKGSSPIEFLLLPKYERNLYQASYNFINGSALDSINLLLENIQLNPNDFRSFLNLNFIISQSGVMEWADLAFHRLNRLEKSAEDNVFLIRSMSNLKIFLGKPDYPTYVNKFLQKFILPCITFKTKKKPILFWHIPKCAGTSFNHYISGKFFNIQPFYMSHYDCEYLHKYIIENQIGALPYISSNHLTIKSIDFNKITDAYFQVAVFRDPVKRAVSSWRQYYQNPAQRLSIIQQHGSYWDYFPKVGLAKWSEKAPQRHLNAITATFSKDLDPEDAIKNIQKLDLWGDTSEVNTLISRVCNEYQLEYNKELVPNKLNATNKSLLFGEGEVEALTNRLVPDLSTCESISSLK